MGNSSSNQNQKQIDELVADFIFELDATELKKLNDANECNKLVLFVAGIIENTLSQTEIKQVSQHITERSDNISLDIARFYVKIAHIYASIVKTINPLGSKSSKDKNKKDVTSLCGSRLFSLLSSKGVDDSKTTNNGIPELDMLYNDSNYDYETGEFKGRSKKMDEVYNKNLTAFYTAYTGAPMDYSIKKFSDIKISSHSTTDEEDICDDNRCDDTVLFEKYALNIANNIKYINSVQPKLIELINRLFIKSNKSNKINSINPELLDKEVSAIVDDARKIIIDLYITCERNYAKGIMIYEAISNKKILNTLQNRRDELIKNRITLLMK
jgi:hypothetical protein